MKAKKVFEFHKTGDPLTSLNLGVAAKVKEKLEEMYEDDNIRTYKIVNLNHIEIFYKPAIIQYYLELKENPKDLSKIKWIIKYIELPKYILNERNYNYNLFDRNFNEHTLSVYETKIYFPNTPHKDNIKYEKVFDIGEFKDKKIHEMGDIIIKALNEKYEPVWGFELVEEQN